MRNGWMKICLFAVLLVGLPLAARAAPTSAPVMPASSLQPRISAPEHSDVGPSLVEIAAMPDAAPSPSDGPRGALHLGKQDRAALPQTSLVQSADGALQNFFGAGQMPTLSANFEGVSNVEDNALNGAYGAPPDTQGDIGADPVSGHKYYVQWVNNAYSIWDVTSGSPTRVLNATNGNTVWAGFGGPCQDTNDGDPITLFDPISNRWLMSQFANVRTTGPFYNCIAVSNTANPLTTTWNRYAYRWLGPTGQDALNDYPKFGVWPDAYYMSVNEFNTTGTDWVGTGVAAFERSKMLSGDPSAHMVTFDLGYNDWGSILPSDFDGLSLPSLGTPNTFLETNASEWLQAGLVDEHRLYDYHVDWATPANSTFTLRSSIPAADLNGNLCQNPYSRTCIPQPGTNQKLDTVADRAMYRLAYRNFGDHESLVSNISVNTVIYPQIAAGIRWTEFRKTPGGAWQLYQEGTYAPDANNRWMGSIAMDHVGNMALGYSVSSANVYPSIRTTGRLAGDPLGLMTQGEGTIWNGTASQTNVERWGDYSMMGIDPVDDCTFWYTQEYATGELGGWGWHTRIASFKYPNCSLGSQGTLAGIVKDGATNQIIAGVGIVASSGGLNYATQTGAGGLYTLNLPAGTYVVTASKYGYTPVTAGGQVVVATQTTTHDFNMAAAAYYPVGGTVTDALTGWPLYARVDITGYPAGSVWTDPLTGHYSVNLVGGDYSLNVTAYVAGYIAGTGSITALAGPATKNFPLQPDQANCRAPGYYKTAGSLIENFDSATVPALPSGWAKANVTGTAGDWVIHTGTSNPGGFPAHSGAQLAYFNSYTAAAGTSTRLYGTSGVNLTGVVAVPVVLWMYHDLQYGTSLDAIQVQISTNGGTVWQNVGAPIYRFNGTSGWAQHTVDATSIAAGQADVRLGLLGISSWGNDTNIDDVTLAPSCQPPAGGGLVSGHVRDGNTGVAINAAAVSNDAGFSTVTASSSDPSQGDGFFVLYSPEGSHVHTASLPAGQYGTDTKNVIVLHFANVAQDFALPSGRLTIVPPALSNTVRLGASSTTTFTLVNTGDRAATFASNFHNRSVIPLLPHRGKLRSAASSSPADMAPPGVVSKQAPASPDGWGAGKPVPTGARYRSAGTSCDGDALYVFGGSNNAGVLLSESWRYDSVTDSWTSLANMPFGLMNMEATCLDGYIYLVGGYDGAAYRNWFQVYDTATNQWHSTTWPNISAPMSAAYQEKIYVFGGYPGPSGETWVFDPALGTWTQMASMPVPVGYGAATTAGNYIYVVGGAESAAFQRYDPAADAWTQGPALPAPRMNAMAVWYGSKLYAVSGGGSGVNLWNAYNDTLVYDLAAFPGGSWTVQGTTVPTPVVGAAYDCVANRIYGVAGTTGTSPSVTYDITQWLDDGQACHYTAAQAPWLSTAPASGTVGINSSVTIEATWHGELPYLTQPTQYLAGLQVVNNTAYPVPNVPLTMTTVMWRSTFWPLVLR